MRLIVVVLFSIFCFNILLAQTNGIIEAKANKQNSSTNNQPSYFISDTHKDELLNIQYNYLQQTYKGIKIYNAIKTQAYKEGNLQYSSGRFFEDLSLIAPTSKPALTPTEAVKIAAYHLNLKLVDSLNIIENTYDTNKKLIFSSSGIAKHQINVELYWLSNDEGKTLNLVWRVEMDVFNSPDCWSVMIDAFNGNVLRKDNYTIYEGEHQVESKQQLMPTNSKAYYESFLHNNFPLLPQPSYTNASYNVIPFPYESRFFANPSIEKNPWTKAGTINNATTYGWHFNDSISYNQTMGNNVWAYDDSLNKNVLGRTDTANTNGASLMFNKIPNFTQQPYTTTNRQFATDNLFYWNNIMHDIAYQYGFTEAAGNFQTYNFNRGGVTRDCVFAEAHNGGGLNNSNFTTYTDGISPIMRMYLYTPNKNVITINTPSSIMGNYYAPESAVSANNLLKNKGVITGNVIFYNDSATSTTTHFACKAPVNNIRGSIAFIYLGSCSSSIQIKNAQLAGAVAVIVCNASGGANVMTGSDNAITIPAVMVSSDDGSLIAAQLKAGIAVNITLFTPVMYDGAIDNSIITHEYTHGISTRLTGGPTAVTCLSNKEVGSEGWSDYVGCMVTTNWNTAQITDGTKSRTHACYANSQIVAGSGNRTYPYSTNMTINPHTYADLAANGEVHYIGEVWCSALWDMTWNIIQQVGSINANIYDAHGGGGNTIALQLVITGLKLQPCKPGFLDSRNAILAADSILYGGIYHCAIWNAFARRGMGYSAVQGSSDNTSDQVAAYDVPCNSVTGRVISPLNIVIPTDSVVNNNGLVLDKKPITTGTYSFILYNYFKNVIRPFKINDVNKLNGISVVDASLIQAHILGVTPLNSPYKLIAADVDNSKTITVLDIIDIKRLLLGKDNLFTGNRRWAFVDSSYKFLNAQNPFPFKDSILVKNNTIPLVNQSFIGVKLGDVNYDWNSTVLSIGNKCNKPVTFLTSFISGNGPNEIKIPIRVKDFNNISSMQYTLRFDNLNLQFKGINNNFLNVEFGDSRMYEGLINFLWLNSNTSGISLKDSTVLMELVFNKIGNDTNYDIGITADDIPIEAWDAAYGFHNIVKGKYQEVTNNLSNDEEGFYVVPNPINEVINIEMYLKQRKRVEFQLYNAQGGFIANKVSSYPKGYSRLNIDLLKKNNLPKGVYYLRSIGLDTLVIRKLLY